MARGFESKDIEFQQAEAERKASVRRAPTEAQRQASAERQTLELTITHVKHELATATSDAHRRMLASALEDLERRRAADSDISG
jgi:hypothetical protein